MPRGKKKQDEELQQERAEAPEAPDQDQETGEPIAVGGPAEDDGLGDSPQDELGGKPAEDQSAIDEQRRTAREHEVRDYYRRLKAVREQAEMLNGAAGRRLVEYLHNTVKFAERKIWKIEKPNQEYEPIRIERDMALKMLEYLKGEVTKFRDYCRSFEGDLFGGHVKHGVSIDDETLIVTIDGPDDDEIERLLTEEQAKQKAEAEAAPHEPVGPSEDAEDLDEDD